MWGSVIALAAMTGCETSDVGAPCNHGPRTPDEPTLTFPALACDQLLCVYAEDHDTPGACQADADCNKDEVDRFVCSEGRCVIDPVYVTERSMCTQTCSSEADCQDGFDGTACGSGFSCVPLQRLGEFCCEKICVCNDDLAAASVQDLADECEAGTAAGCCDRDPVPEACGPQ